MSFSKGIIKDTAPINQPEGTLRHAINIILNDKEGGVGSIVVEPGTELCYDFTPYRVLGSVYIGNDETLVFTSNGTSSRIGILKECEYTLLIDSECLNLTSNITGTLFNNNNCNRLVIFRGDNIPDMQIDLNNLENYYTEDFANYLASGMDFNSYTGERWECNSFLLEPDYKVARINSVETVNTGGNLPLGSYWFALRYIDESGNKTPYFHISNKSIVTATNTNNPPYYITGGYNEQYQSEVIGGIPTTTKSLRISVSGVDTRYDKLEITVIRSVTGDGVTREAFTLIPIDITSSSTSYLYDGYHVTDTDLQDIQVDPVFYYKSGALTVMDNRLVRANVKEKDYDWGKFQQLVNNITVKYVVNKRATPSPDNFVVPEIEPLHRDNSALYTSLSMPADEIVALGIRFQLKSGRFTPVFHIPGRESTVSSVDITQGNSNTHCRNQVSGSVDWDKQLLTVVNTTPLDDEVHIDNVEHLEVSVGDTIPRWKVYNTSIRFVDHGIPGYYETQTRYPDTKDCGGNPIYPHTVNSNGSITMDYIRHHRMPDRNLVPLEDRNLVSLDIRYNIINLLIENVAYPSLYEDEIVGWELVVAKPQESDRTVVGRGILERCIHGIQQYPQISADFDPAEDDITDTYIIQSPYYNYLDHSSQVFGPGFQLAGTNAAGFPDLTGIDNESELYYSLYTSEGLFNKEQVQGDYIKIEGYAKGIPEVHSFRDSKTNTWNTVANEEWFTSSLDLTFGEVNSSSTIAGGVHMRQIKDSVVLGFQDSRPQGGNAPGYKSLGNQPNQIIKLKDNIQLNNLRTSDIGDDEGYLYPEKPTQNVNYHIVTVKKVRNNAYADIDNLEYIQISPFLYTSDSAEIKGGIVHIDQVGVRKTMITGDIVYSFRTLLRKPTTGDFLLAATGIGSIIWGPKNDYQRVINGHITFHTESEINIGLRHEGLLMADIYTERDSSGGNQEDINQGNVNSFWPISYGIDGIKEYLELPPNFINFFEVNPDYNMYNDINIYRGVLTGFCNDCTLDNRIVWSPPNSPGINLALDAKDITKNKGSIVDIVPYKGSLIIRTEQSLFRVPSNKQVLQANESTVDITSGDFLSLDPQELVETSTGFISCTGIYQTVATPYGVFILDTVEGALYKFDGQLTNLSAKGMAKWFRDNARLTAEINYNVDSPVQIGGYLFYDPALKRIFIVVHNKDGDLPDNVCLTYDAELGVFDSFHGYFQKYAYNDRNYMYGTTDSFTVYKHLIDDKWGQLYGKNLFNTIEVVATHGRDSFLDSIYLVMDVYRKENLGLVPLDDPKSIMSLLVRNTSQASLDLVNVDATLPTEYDTNEDIVYMTKRANWYVISGFRNTYLPETGLPMVTEDKNYMRLNPLYDDMSPVLNAYASPFSNTLPDNYSNNFRFRDKFHIIRLTFGDSTEPQRPKIVIYGIDTVDYPASI